MAGGGMAGGGDHGPGSMIAGEDRQVSEENRKVLEWIAQVLNASTREAALLELSKKREQVPELALILWHSFGTYMLVARKEGGVGQWCFWWVGMDLALLMVRAGVMTSLLQEIISVYPLLNPSQLTAAASNRVCNALALLQCVASHHETRALFLGGA